MNLTNRRIRTTVAHLSNGPLVGPSSHREGNYGTSSGRIPRVFHDRLKFNGPSLYLMRDNIGISPEFEHVSIMSFSFACCRIPGKLRLEVPYTDQLILETPNHAPFVTFLADAAQFTHIYHVIWGLLRPLRNAATSSLLGVPFLVCGENLTIYFRHAKAGRDSLQRINIVSPDDVSG